MIQRPIPFSAPMIRALLDGTKTQTRRVVKAKPDRNLGTRCMLLPHELAGEINRGEYSNSKHGKPGDGLWVRESYRASNHFDHDPPRIIPHGAEIWYEATSIAKVWRSTVGRLRPSMFMCQWMSRITLEIISVRVERLQEISDDDAMAEGAEPTGDREGTFVSGYKRLWGHINGPESWTANPFVWVTEFKVVKP